MGDLAMVIMGENASQTKPTPASGDVNRGGGDVLRMMSPEEAAMRISMKPMTKFAAFLAAEITFQPNSAAFLPRAHAESASDAIQCRGCTWRSQLG